MCSNMVNEVLSTPVRYSCDVCVVGGGVAGIAAALSAARAAKQRKIPTKVLLLERSYLLGGLATAGLVTIYLPICDGRGRQVCYGLGEELLKLSIEHGAEDRYPKEWLEGPPDARPHQRYQVQFNAQLFAISAERLLKEAGVKILYGAMAVGTTVKDGRITHVILEGKSGREAIEVTRSAIDASGDADLCKFSGAKTAEYPEGNKLAAWYYGVGEGKLKLYMCGVHDVADTKENTELEDTERYCGTDTEELSRLTEVSHRSLIQNLLRRRKEIADLVPVTIATTPQIRMTRRLVGRYTQDVSEYKAHYEDSVGIYPNWRKRGPVYELPLSALYGNEIKNLLVAGRCISVTDALWDITRVIPVCAVSGEAAGVAAAVSDDLSCADIPLIQSILKSAGVRLRWEYETEEL